MVPTRNRGVGQTRMTFLNSLNVIKNIKYVIVLIMYTQKIASLVLIYDEIDTHWFGSLEIHWKYIENFIKIIKIS